MPRFILGTGEMDIAAPDGTDMQIVSAVNDSAVSELCACQGIATLQIDCRTVSIDLWSTHLETSLFIHVARYTSTAVFQ